MRRPRGSIRAVPPRPTTDHDAGLSAADALVPVSVPAVYEVVAERIRRAIHLGAFADGDQLPSERELARALGVSRVSLREALSYLEGRGYVTKRRGPTGGPVVRAGGDHVAALRASLVGRIDELEELMGFRAIIEGAAAERAARLADAGDLAAIDAAVAALPDSRTVSGFRRADSAFHLAIATAARNRNLRDAILDARDPMFAPVDVLPYDVMLGSTLDAHRRIAAAVRRGRPAAARRAMEEHVEESRVELRRALGLDP